MKIILISSTPPPMGGIAKWTERMLHTKLPDGWSIELVNDGILGKREPFGDNIGYDIFNEIKRWFGVWIRLLKVCRQNSAPIVHACPIATQNSMLVNIVSACISRLCGKKHIIHFRCTVPNLVHTSLQRILLKILCKLSNKIIALNRQTLDFLKNETSTPIIIIPNFVDNKELCSSKNISNTCRRVLYVGGVTKEKGCDHIVEIARKLPEIEFRLVGKASSEIVNMAQGLENVYFAGLKDKAGVIDEMQNADVFIFLSRFWGEGFSNAVAEAMASGLPCIVTDWAANADQVEQGRGGFVVGKDVVNDSIIALSRLKAPLIRKQFSDFNTTKVIKEYSADIIVEKYVKCYESLL